MTTKTQKQFRLDNLTVTRLHALADALDMTQVDVVTHAINDFYNAHMTGAAETRDLDQLAEDVTAASVYPHTSEMRQECRDWLADGDGIMETVEVVSAMWNEHLQDAGICLRVTVDGGHYRPDEDVSWWPEVEAEAESAEMATAVTGWAGWSQVWRVLTDDGEVELYFRP